MPIPKRAVRLPTLTGGMNDSYDTLSIRQDQATLIRNCHLDPRGIAYTRKGSRVLNSTALAGKVTSIYEYRRPDGSGTTTVVLVTAGLSLYTYSESAGFTVIAALSGSGRPTWETFQDGSAISYAIMANGTDFIKYDGTTVTNVATSYPWTDNPRYIKAYDDRLLASGCDSDPYKVFVCKILDCTDWFPAVGPAAAYWTMKGEKGDRVTGLGRVYDFGVIFQERATTIITEADPDSSTSQQVQVSSQYGTSSHWSVVSVGSYLYFADESHVYKGMLRDAIEDGLQVVPIEDSVDTLFKTSKSNNDIVAQYDAKNEEIEFGLQTGVSARKNKTLVYSVRLSDAKQFPVWAGYLDGTGYEPYTLGAVTDSDGKPGIWRGDEDGYVYAMEESQQWKDEKYVSAVLTEYPIVTEIRPAALAPGGFGVTKRAREVVIRGYSYKDDSLTVQWVVDGRYILPSTAIGIDLTNTEPYWREDTVTDMDQLWNTTVWSDMPLMPKIVNVSGPFNYIQFVLRCEGSNTKDEIAYAGLELWFQYHKMGKRVI